MKKELIFKVLAYNRELIEIFSKLRELSAEISSDKLEEALSHIDKATELLSEVWYVLYL